MYTLNRKNIYQWKNNTKKELCRVAKQQCLQLIEDQIKVAVELGFKTTIVTLTPAYEGKNVLRLCLRNLAKRNFTCKLIQKYKIMISW